ncbi:putative deubiquitinase DESI2 [Blattamonas nauphoetae]|uniref:Deubiquitinase DESI2 n=1 Tax=Blattamonas nauphoetae TaxID=2049346 RepID=A0ABQ9YA58_9EUKA|nr:putative deubiquitinase DESI2 [Blattamonas nauphoetae]
MSTALVLRPRGYPVFVNIYTLFVNGKELKMPFGWGIYHSGTEIDGTEWAFGGDLTGTGVWSQPPMTVWPHSPLRDRIYMGESRKTKAEIREIITQLENEYPSVKYHFCHMNCHDFTEDIVTRLVGPNHTPLPKYLNKLARFGRIMSPLVGKFVKQLRKPTEEPTGPTIPSFHIPDGNERERQMLEQQEKKAKKKESRHKRKKQKSDPSETVSVVSNDSLTPPDDSPQIMQEVIASNPVVAVNPLQTTRTESQNSSCVSSYESSPAETPRS